MPDTLQLNPWALGGLGVVGTDGALSRARSDRMGFRFHARDWYLVMGSSAGCKPIRFRVTLDGRPAGTNRGGDIDASGAGMVSEQRLYQLIRQSVSVRDRTFAIEFLDDGVGAYSFTFG